MNAKKEKYENIVIHQPLRPILGKREVERLREAIAYTVCDDSPVDCFLGNAAPDGSAMMVGKTLTLRAYSPEGPYPVSIARFIGRLNFPNRFSLISFLLLHELAHRYIPSARDQDETLCDILAVSLQSDFKLGTPKLLDEASEPLLA